MIIRYILLSLLSGILFAIMDGLINANPLAVRLYAVYKPIARQSINRTAGIIIDLVFGFVMAGVFLLLYASLPGLGLPGRLDGLPVLHRCGRQGCGCAHGGGGNSTVAGHRVASEADRDGVGRHCHAWVCDAMGPAANLLSLSLAL